MRTALSTVLVLLAMLCSCGGDGSSGGEGAGEQDSRAESSAGERQAGADSGADEPTRPAATVAPSHCRAGIPDCRTTKGRIVYVERVDPDGDGDAHFVVFDPQGITLPYLTAIDVSAELRPDPLPGPGELISAAGPVQTGSQGQNQIHAIEVHTAAR